MRILRFQLYIHPSSRHIDRFTTPTILGCHGRSYSTEADTHTHAHTHTYECMHATLPDEHLQENKLIDLEIDKVSTDALLSTGKSPTIERMAPINSMYRSRNMRAPMLGRGLKPK
jgi:hypothetical protein